MLEQQLHRPSAHAYRRQGQIRLSYLFCPTSMACLLVHECLQQGLCSTAGVLRVPIVLVHMFVSSCTKNNRCRPIVSVLQAVLAHFSPHQAPNIHRLL